MAAVPTTPVRGGPANLADGAGGSRRHEVDAVRGLVMIVMALDHLRDFLGSAHIDATDLARTTAPIFWDVALSGSPPSYGFNLAGVYAIWLAVIAALYPVCRRYGARSHRQ